MLPITKSPLIEYPLTRALQTFFAELETLEKKGLTNVHERILISDRCTIDFDLHVAVDGLEEIELGANSIGTTRRGIGPSYSTRASVWCAQPWMFDRG